MEMIGATVIIQSCLIKKNAVASGGYMVDICGAELKNVEDEIHACNGEIWQGLRSALSPEEHKVPKDYGNGLVSPDPIDPCPRLHLVPKIDECEGSLLFPTERMIMDTDEVSGENIYRNCVKV